MKNRTIRVTVEMTDDDGVFRKSAVLVYDEKVKRALTSHAANNLKESILKAHEVLTKVKEQM